MDTKHYTFVTYGPEVDAVYALYIGGVWHVGGDNYHTNAASVIKGWIDCLRWMGKGDEVCSFNVPVAKCRSIPEDGDTVPEKWPNKYSKHATPGELPR